jgi:hypothetical protein
MSLTSSFKALIIGSGIAALLTVVAGAALPSSAQALEGCSAQVGTHLPTGYIYTTICAEAATTTGVWNGEFRLDPDRAFGYPYRYTRCQVWMSAQVGNSTIRAQPINCTDEITHKIGWWYYAQFIAGYCGEVRIWGHLSVAYNHDQVYNTPTQQVQAPCV